MKFVFVFVCLIGLGFGLGRLAHADEGHPPVTVPGLSADQPVCYGREYSDKEIGARKGQRVKLMRVKFFMPEGYDGNGISMNIQSQLKTQVKDNETGDLIDVVKPYTSDLWCTGGQNGQLDCGVECDGVSVTMNWKASEAVPAVMSLTNSEAGLVLSGGCGGGVDDEDLRLTPTREGDNDKFELVRLPAQFCQP